MNDGWIKLHRKMLDWEWYDEPKTFRLFMHCLLKANHKPKRYRGKVIEEGQFLTGRDSLAQETQLSIQNIRTAFSNLESTNELTIKTSSQGTMVTVVKYREYQLSNQQSNQQVTNDQPASNQQVTTNKKRIPLGIQEGKNEKKKDLKESKPKKSRFTPPTPQEVNQYLEIKETDQLGCDFCDFYASKGWMVGKTKMKDWKAAARRWQRNEYQPIGRVGCNNGPRQITEHNF